MRSGPPSPPPLLTTDDLAATLYASYERRCVPDPQPGNASFPARHNCFVTYALPGDVT